VKVELVSDFNSPTGYSAHARALLRSIKAIEGVDLKVRPHKADKASIILSDEEKEEYRQMMAKEWKPDVRIHFEIPNYYSNEKDVYTIGFTEWETTRIPDRAVGGSHEWNWVKRMNDVQEIWTSCTEAINAFQNSGVETDCYVVAGPVDTEVFKPGLRELKIRGLTAMEDGTPIPKENRRKILGFMGSWTKRKNIEDWIVLLTTQFAPDQVEGLLKVHVGIMGDGQQRRIIQERVDQIRLMCRMVKGCRLNYISEVLTDEEVACWFQTPDVYVSLSRGEGLGLPVLQAMACESLVVHTGWGAVTDYIDDSNGFLIQSQLEPVYGMEYQPYWANQYWARACIPHAAQVVARILQADNKGSERLDEMRKNARKRVVDHHSIPAITKVIAARLKEIGS
jgi:glycosyltransferase involved in cell wall biosynthesis